MYRKQYASLLAGAVVGCSMAVGAASASTTCATSDVTINLIGGTSVASINATACAGAFAGNDVGAQGTLLDRLNGEGDFENEALFDDFAATFFDDWTQFGKSDVMGSGVTATTDPDDETIGTWSVDFTPSAEKVFAVSLKGGNSFSVYLFELSEGSNLFGGDYSMQGVFRVGNNQNIPKLSHLTVATWSGGRTDLDVGVIPLPAAGWLLISGLGALGLMSRRRRKAA